MSNATPNPSKTLAFDLDSYQELYGKYRALKKEYSTYLSGTFTVVSATIAVAIVTLTITLPAVTWAPNEPISTIAPAIDLTLPLIVIALISSGISWSRRRGLKKHQPERIEQQLNAMVKEYLVDRYGIQKMQLLEVGEPMQWHELLLETLELSMLPAKVRVLDADHRTTVFSVRFVDGKPTFIADESI